mgnify:CR=1 FL=1
MKSNKHTFNFKNQVIIVEHKEKFTKFSKNWHPHQVAIVDDMQVILAKLKGQFVWHSHDNEDELFQVVKGTLYMQFRDKTEVVNEGEFIVVPKGVEHKPFAENECKIMLVEPIGVVRISNIDCLK